MTDNTSRIQQQYQGYLQTPPLWGPDTLFGLQQLLLPPRPTTLFTRRFPPNIRLGKRVEHFVFHELEHYDTVALLAENVQIQQEQRTVGELDLLMQYQKNPIHLEIVYKFYIYDARVGTTALDHWIGPNRKDSLVEKLTKLRDKQLPLLHRPETKPLLDSLNITAKTVTQYVNFKAQLFLPLGTASIPTSEINDACIVGFYCHTQDLEQFTDCKFYIPNKTDWLIQPHAHVNWLPYEDCDQLLRKAQQEQKSECCWIKHPNGMIDKSFVVWW